VGSSRRETYVERGRGPWGRGPRSGGLCWEPAKCFQARSAFWTSNLFNQLRWGRPQQGRRSGLARRGPEPTGSPSAPGRPPSPSRGAVALSGEGQPPRRGEAGAAWPPRRGGLCCAGRAGSRPRAWGWSSRGARLPWPSRAVPTRATAQPRRRTAKGRGGGALGSSRHAAWWHEGIPRPGEGFLPPFRSPHGPHNRGGWALSGGPEALRRQG